ncbi:hypothetical protein H0274_01590 [Altererythrobacter sp. CC-YST694]|uniref:hypothetical protein n=1 Tax=Altererythrobacter sp. CC-YST694 TaxID=2755038 RepID=UPI001D012C0C|nr:hypothetical protein [Altererythrobacter sp. CC-YST694]MCB5423937.1 hypothetical protein [Altererythrobacter sp. CC-YST694]
MIGKTLARHAIKPNLPHSSPRQAPVTLGGGSPLAPAQPIKHTLLPISEPEWRYDPAALEVRLAERNRRVQAIAAKVQLAILAILALGLAVGLPIMGKNIWLGVTTPQEARP